MSRKLILFLIIFICNCKSYSQTTKINDIYSLKPISDITDKNKLLLLLNELVSLGTAFKYRTDILEGNFKVESHLDKFIIRIFKKK